MNGKMLFSILFFTAAAGFAQELTLETIVSEVIANDESLQIARESIDSAYQGYRITRAQGYPQVTLSTEPIYGIGMRRDSDFTTFPPEPRTTVSNSFNLGIGLTQLLPTGGSISTQIDDTFQYNVRLPSEETESSAELLQQPSFGLQYNQPIFVNGKLIDGQLMKAANKSAELGWQSSKEAEQSTKNTVILRASQLYIQLIRIEKNKEFIQSNFELARKQLEQSMIDKEQGRASANQVLGLEVALNKQQEALLDTELARIQTEYQLGRMIGKPDLGDNRVVDSLQLLMNKVERHFAAKDGTDLYEKAMINNPDIIAKRFERESRRLQALTNDREHAANMALTFTISPRYPDEREDEESFSASFSDFFEEDAGVNLNFGLSFQVPLTDGGRRKAVREADKTAVRIAELNISAQEKSVAEKIMVAQKKDELLRKRIDLLQVDVEYQKNRLEREEQLASLNTSTKLKVDTVRIDLLAAEQQLWQTRADLLLNLLELLSLTGEAIEDVIL